MANYTDYNGTISAYGLSPQDIAVRVNQIAYGLNIIGQEDEAAYAKTFYVRQVQEDVFYLTVEFITAKERRDFFSWYQNYAIQATKPSPVGPMRVQVPSRNFDFYGTLTQGVQEVTTPQDVTWNMTLQFNGAQPTTSLSSAYINDGSAYQAQQDETVSDWFYPNSPSPAQNLYDATQSIDQVAKEVQSVISGAIHFFKRI